ncbi:threonine synthase [Candidatus Kaiserbacteria bacterium RIFCSPHIGHO2_01_FULL_56_24]|uniref:Threonine synthase n=1 Tax=Candidatus Kaiserbacteria bacterium RIFCSPHIGHO2_01_FULL_56_24 TaxID=1798487 RepID=A0A1F6DAZ9_9BACT|nr:MAG: threonine synthase [Candidatus Kaiserbacteria bacterium RIFCSPHIGHO2_01_FULL_56_24]
MLKSLVPVSKGTVLRCIACGNASELLSERAFVCTSCGGLLEVHHDFSGMNSGMVTELKHLFDSRAVQRIGNSRTPQTASGVWRFQELIMPNLQPEHIVTLGEGLVPIVHAGKHLHEWLGGDIDVSLILEGLGPTGSFKDFGGTVMMSVAKAAGVKAVGCASTGDTSAMAAAYATAAGIMCFVLLPKGKVTPVQLMQPAAHGAQVITLPGTFDDCMRVMRELVANYGAYPANSLNPARIEGHQATVFLIAQAMEWSLPDWFAVPVGNGSNSSSIGKGIRLLKDLGFVKTASRILGCQAEAANPLARSWPMVRDVQEGERLEAWRREFRPMTVGETTATAARIGDPVSREKVMREVVSSNGVMTTSTERDLNEAIFVCARDGYLVCPQTGIALAGLRNAIQDGHVLKGERVVVVSTATGLKFSSAFESRTEDVCIEAEDTRTSTVARILELL